jgi:hypothetical protein
MKQSEQIRALAERIAARAASNRYTDGSGPDLVSAVLYLRNHAADVEAKEKAIRDCGREVEHPGTPATIAG